MNKTIAFVSILGVAILSPIASMGISPLRESILGMAPQDSVLALADKIDSNRVDVEQKIAEKDTQLEALKASNAELQSKIDSQNKQIESQKSDLSQVKIDASNTSVKQVENTRQSDCNTVHNLYLTFPTKPNNASRVGPASNIVELYKIEKEFIEENKNDPEGISRTKNDFRVVTEAYNNFESTKNKLCPEFKEF